MAKAELLAIVAIVVISVLDRYYLLQLQQDEIKLWQGRLRDATVCPPCVHSESAFAQSMHQTFNLSSTSEVSMQGTRAEQQDNQRPVAAQMLIHSFLLQLEVKEAQV